MLQKPVFRIRMCFIRIRIQVFFNSDPDPVPKPGKKTSFFKGIKQMWVFYAKKVGILLKR